MRCILIEALKTEPVEAALQRSIATMMDWATEQNAQWSDYFRLVNTNRAVATHPTGQDQSMVVVRLQRRQKDVKII